jgi:hypothetical protein
MACKSSLMVVSVKFKFIGEAPIKTLATHPRVYASHGIRLERPYLSGLLRVIEEFELHQKRLI